MHYIQDGPFEELETFVDTTIGEMVNVVAGLYQPVEGLKLVTSEIRQLNFARDVLDAGPEDGYFAFEDAPFKVLGRVVVAMAENSKGKISRLN